MPTLKEQGLTVLYLQFDGLQRASYLKIRGQDMTAVRQQSVAAARAAGLCCNLAVAVTRGVNDDEIGAIVRFAVDNIDTMRAINFQSATRFTGRLGTRRRAWRLDSARAVETHRRPDRLAGGAQRHDSRQRRSYLGARAHASGR